ncbi:MAG: hydroxymethylbilane synthase [Alphaproteobacteria bacterium]|nr:hydroxymethylbilane synthase [Alphaproteobacteria bacterium]
MRTRGSEIFEDQSLKGEGYIVGTRKSPLALAQTTIVIDALRQANPTLSPIQVVGITTTGDRITDQSLSDIGGKALFVKEIEQSLLNKEIDFAIHSLKDLETHQPSGLTIACVLEREDARDVLITRQDGLTLKTLKQGAIIGTCSPRRAMQLLAHRPDFRIIPIRGNVQTRLRQIQSSGYDGTILALAGLKRLGLLQDENSLSGYSDLCVTILSLKEMLPAAGQGVIAIEARSDDSEILSLLRTVNHDPTELCIRAERSLLRELGGNCHTSIAAFASIIDPEILALDVVYAPRDVPIYYREEISLSNCSPEDFGIKLARYLKNS